MTLREEEVVVVPVLIHVRKHVVMNVETMLFFLLFLVMVVVVEFVIVVVTHRV